MTCDRIPIHTGVGIGFHLVLEKDSIDEDFSYGGYITIVVFSLLLACFFNAAVLSIHMCVFLVSSIYKAWTCWILPCWGGTLRLPP